MADSSRPAPAVVGQPAPRRWKALAVCFIGGFVTMLHISIVDAARDAATVAIAIASASIAAALLIAWADLRRRVR